jgi:hypothetical protein
MIPILVAPAQALGDAHILTVSRHTRESGYPEPLHQVFCRRLLGPRFRGDDE